MRTNGYIGWIVDSGRSPQWLLKEYRNKVRRIIHIRQILRSINHRNKDSGGRHSSFTTTVYERCLNIRMKDAEDCRKAIRWLVRQGFIGSK
ncbi:MAG: hypothetical protein JSU72_17125 [Deltaproteobacteria bacterium]|nr:MAG: hypothetical protein JSU72_17125 [Deltaproteobacteria bacterium]